MKNRSNKLISCKWLYSIFNFHELLFIPDDGYTLCHHIWTFEKIWVWTCHNQFSLLSSPFISFSKFYVVGCDSQIFRTFWTKKLTIPNLSNSYNNFASDKANLTILLLGIVKSQHDRSKITVFNTHYSNCLHLQRKRIVKGELSRRTNMLLWTELSSYMTARTVGREVQKQNTSIP